MLGQAQRGYAPRTPSTWIFGESGNAEVWTVDGDDRVMASVMVSTRGSIILLNRYVAGSEREIGCLNWALRLIAFGHPVFSVLLSV